MSRILPGHPSATPAAQNLRARIAQSQQRLAAHWQRLAPRERRLVVIAATVGGLALTWQLLFMPAWRTTQTLSSTLPTLRAQAAQLDTILAQSRELSRLQGSNTALTEADLSASLARAGLAPHAALAAEGNGWSITLTAAPIQPVLAWLRDVGYELRTRPDEVDLARVADEAGAILPGLVSGTVRFAQGDQP